MVVLILFQSQNRVFSSLKLIFDSTFNNTPIVCSLFVNFIIHGPISQQERRASALIIQVLINHNFNQNDYARPINLFVSYFLIISKNFLNSKFVLGYS